MKKFVFYPGCVMQTEQYAYEISLREILPKFDVELVDTQGFSCCGEPLKSVNQMLSLSLAARNIALAEKKNLEWINFIPGRYTNYWVSFLMHLDNAPTAGIETE